MLINFLVTKAQAQISNPAIDATLGNNPTGAADGTLFTDYFLRVWNAVITVGALAVIVMFVWGAIDWITSGGDASKIQKGRDRMIQSIIGLVLLVASFALIGFISTTFFGTDFNILELQFGV